LAILGLGLALVRVVVVATIALDSIGTRHKFNFLIFILIRDLGDFVEGG